MTYKELSTVVEYGQDKFWTYIDTKSSTVLFDVLEIDYFDEGGSHSEYLRNIAAVPLGDNLFNFLSIQDNDISMLSSYINNNKYWNGCLEENSEESFIRSFDCIYIYILFYSNSRYTLSINDNYLLNLKNEFDFALNFCCNVDFVPNLKDLTALERYYIYSTLYSYTKSISLDKISSMRNYFIQSKDPVKYIERLRYPHSKNVIQEIPEFDDFTINELKKSGVSVVPRYNYDMLEMYLFEELYALIQSNIKVKKCVCCGKYFITKGNYATKYCDRINPGNKFTCKKIGAMNNRRKKVDDSPILQEYQKAYKRYYARMSSQKISKEDFRIWSENARAQLDMINEKYGTCPPENIINDFKLYLRNH